MRTIDEFAAVCRARDRRFYRAFVFGCVVAAFWMLGGLVLLVAVSLPHTDSDDFSVAPFVILVAVFVPPAVGAAILAWRLDRKLRRVPGATCPNCEQLLVGLITRQQVVATKQCPSCRCHVLSDPASVPDAHLMRPLAEVASADRAGRWRSGRWFIAALVGHASGMFVPAAISTEWPEAWPATPTDSQVEALVLEVSVFVTLTIVIPAICLAVAIILNRRVERNPVVRCPHCGGRFSVEILRDTGNCGHCGRRAVALPDSPPAG